MKLTHSQVYLLIALVMLPVIAIFTQLSTPPATAQTTDSAQASDSSVKNPLTIGDHFTVLVTERDFTRVQQSLDIIEQQWSLALAPMAIEVLGYTRSKTVEKTLTDLLVKEAGENYQRDFNQWYRWLWQQDIKPVASYANFKSTLYRIVDPIFEEYFRDRQETARIRLDEIRWGGVRQDGIPPLRNPKMLAADDANYLQDDNIVFGIKINGDARAYPKRILAWHEMFTDTIGGVKIAGVYCTLCGTVIPYRTEHKGVAYQLGTSGFLYRSNKLMYDKATQSLWSTERGEPVLGDLVDKGIQLEYESVVTTTWGEWKKRHPKTTVLSNKTGHIRNYAEGFAYADYFATDELMFNTPFNDQRLKNKQEVLALRFAAAPKEQLAIDTDFLNNNPIYTNAIGRQGFIVFTDKTGANRVYDPKEINFIDYDGGQIATDENGVQWQVGEESLVASDGRQLSRLPYHRAFWFGWHAAFPDTQLIK